jgi:hypothetical protein
VKNCCFSRLLLVLGIALTSWMCSIPAQAAMDFGAMLSKPPAAFFDLGRDRDRDHEIKNGDQVVTVFWEVEASPLAICSQPRSARRSFAVSHKDACATVRLENSMADPVCTIVTTSITTHQDMGALLQWCMSKGAVLKRYLF